MIQRRTLIGAIGAVALSSASYFPMTACAAMPRGEGSDPIRIVVPYPPGGPLDVSARTIAEAVVESLGNVIVDNRPGAGGGVGMGYVKRRRVTDARLWSALSPRMRSIRISTSVCPMTPRRISRPSRSSPTCPTSSSSRRNLFRKRASSPFRVLLNTPRRTRASSTMPRAATAVQATWPANGSSRSRTSTWFTSRLRGRPPLSFRCSPVRRT